jgi:hypothetical protein
LAGIAAGCEKCCCLLRNVCNAPKFLSSWGQYNYLPLLRMSPLQIPTLEMELHICPTRRTLLTFLPLWLTWHATYARQRVKSMWKDPTALTLLSLSPSHVPDVWVFFNLLFFFNLRHGEEPHPSGGACRAPQAHLAVAAATALAEPFPSCARSYRPSELCPWGRQAAMASPGELAHGEQWWRP